jgi:benzoyl-CoA reductase/2-hydroxyglutaryl-CoA dehydratase subunit BcrC/BadD/HgdB
MTTEEISYVGFTCAYTPVALIEATGFAPYRILPTGNSPDQAGRILHDNLCPHVKRVLDRALADDVPDLAGLVLLNSCDAMRRLADAWQAVRPGDRIIVVDLPVTSDTAAVSYFGRELSRLADTLSQWSGRPVSQDAMAESIERYNQAALLFQNLSERQGTHGGVQGGAARVQSLYNMAVTQPLHTTHEMLKAAVDQSASRSGGNGGVPVFVFGNVLPDPEAFDLFESCGARIVDEDFCTGSRGFVPIQMQGSGDIPTQLARGLLSRPRCARTLRPEQTGVIAEEVAARAVACNASGVIACTAKFCDPYLSRLPGVREALRTAGLPMLQIEGDCTMRSFGQQCTRIEAFIEMLRR